MTKISLLLVFATACATAEGPTDLSKPECGACDEAKDDPLPADLCERIAATTSSPETSEQDTDWNAGAALESSLSGATDFPADIDWYALALEQRASSAVSIELTLGAGYVAEGYAATLCAFYVDDAGTNKPLSCDEGGLATDFRTRLTGCCDFADANAAVVSMDAGANAGTIFVQVYSGPSAEPTCGSYELRAN